MTECSYCEAIEEKKLLIYEDDKVYIFLHDKPALPGHLIGITKEHFPILEEVPDPIIAHLFIIVNKISAILFDSLNIQGTNILVNNGLPAGQDKPHFSVEIIPRIQNDSIGLIWEPKQLSEEEMSTIELQLTDNSKNIGHFEQEKEEPITIEQPKKIIATNKENYLTKQLRRIP